MNVLFPFLAIAAVLWSALHQMTTGIDVMTILTEQVGKSAADALQLALTLAGMMAVFMGLLRVVENAQILPLLSRPLAPLLRWLFPSLGADHPALNAIGLNVSANLLGMGNAATPFGLRAMEQLEAANPRPTIASHAQIMFLALNTAGITLLPAKVIALRASMGSSEPAIIMGPTLAASLCAALAGITAALILDRERLQTSGTQRFWAAMIPILAIGLLAAFMLRWGAAIGPWLLPLMVAGFLLLGVAKGVRVYEAFVEGTRDGLMVTFRILPYLLAIMLVVGLARSSGVLDQLLHPIALVLQPLGLAPEALLMAVTRTLSGSGSFGLLATYLGQSASGPDTPLGILLSTIYGSTETTFYVIAVYFGSVGIRSLRHAITIGLIADAAGLVAACLICPLISG